VTHERHLVALGGKGVLMKIEALAGTWQSREAHDAMAGVGVHPIVSKSGRRLRGAGGPDLADKNGQQPGDESKRGTFAETGGSPERFATKAAEHSRTPRRFAPLRSPRNSARSWSAAVPCAFGRFPPAADCRLARSHFRLFTFRY